MSKRRTRFKPASGLAPERESKPASALGPELESHMVGRDRWGITHVLTRTERGTWRGRIGQGDDAQAFDIPDVVAQEWREQQRRHLAGELVDTRATRSHGASA